MGVRAIRPCAGGVGRATISGNMPKSSDDNFPSEIDVRAALVQGMQPLFDVGDNVQVLTKAGAKLEGVVDDANASGILVRSSANRVFFVPYSSMDHSEIFEEDGDEGDGEDADGGESPKAPVGDGGAPVTPIGRSAA